MSVKGYAAFGPGEALKPFSYEPDALGPHDVEIEVTHCGICHSDVHLIDNDWGITKYPTIPGHEVVGEVAGLGCEVKGLAKGDRVGVGWQAGSCLHCEWCVSGQENRCGEQSAVCVGRYGGFAEALRVDGRFAFPIPKAISSEHASPLLCGGITVYTPLRAHAHPWSRVGVVGIGGLGHFAVQFAKAFGCEVTAFSTTAEKEKEAVELGAHHFALCSDAKQMKKAAESLDLIVSTVHVDMDWESWMRVLRPNGVLALVGVSDGPLNIAPDTLLLGKKAVVGSTIGTRSAMREMLEFAGRHGIRAWAEVVPMSQVNDAVDRVRKGKARYRMVLKQTK
ncbi:MAG: NAD(P)-dependent alcohol dehydrogenase [Elusimicrobia bacterium]|nr:NAD(P)-dependent alcohol dehydrogenase [Elusimicrobiota bacterium]